MEVKMVKENILIVTEVSTMVVGKMIKKKVMEY
jgi:hypothetical protein